MAGWRFCSQAPQAIEGVGTGGNMRHRTAGRLQLQCIGGDFTVNGKGDHASRTGVDEKLERDAENHGGVQAGDHHIDERDNTISFQRGWRCRGKVSGLRDPQWRKPPA